MEGIEYPKRNTEAEIQAVLLYKLRDKKIDARLQVTAFNPSSGKKSCKLDMVIFVDKIAKCIIECKSWSRNYSKTAAYRLNNTKQLRKYRAIYQLPVLVCANMESISTTIKEVDQIIIH